MRIVIRWEQGQSVLYPYYREQLCSLFGKNARELGLLAQDEKVNASLSQVHQDAMQLIAMDDARLALTDGTGLRNDIDTLASIVLNGGIDPKTGKTEKGVSSIAASIQQLATMDVTHY